MRERGEFYQLGPARPARQGRRSGATTFGGSTREENIWWGGGGRWVMEAARPLPLQPQVGVTSPGRARPPAGGGGVGDDNLGPWEVTARRPYPQFLRRSDCLLFQSSLRFSYSCDLEAGTGVGTGFAEGIRPAFSAPGGGYGSREDQAEPLPCFSCTHILQAPSKGAGPSQAPQFHL